MYLILVAKNVKLNGNRTTTTFYAIKKVAIIVIDIRVM